MLQLADIAHTKKRGASHESFQSKNQEQNTLPWCYRGSR